MGTANPSTATLSSMPLLDFMRSAYGVPIVRHVLLDDFGNRIDDPIFDYTVRGVVFHLDASVARLGPGRQDLSG